MAQMFLDDTDRTAYLSWATDITKVVGTVAYEELKTLQRLTGHPENQRRLQKLEPDARIEHRISLKSATIPMVKKGIGVTTADIEKGQYFFMICDIKEKAEPTLDDELDSLLSAYGVGVDYLMSFALPENVIARDEAREKIAKSPFNSNERIYEPSNAS